MLNCKVCAQPFIITEAETDLRKKLSFPSVPTPRDCPDCRMQQRLAFRNELNFHKTTCALTGKSILTNYPPERGYKIFASETWYSDQWDPLDYGRDFDFSRPFFEQFGELLKNTPHVNLMMNKSENCDYCNFCTNSKDCYLSARVGFSEQAYYSWVTMNSYRCFD